MIAGAEAQAAEGQQLVLEAVAIMGALLLALDRCIPGFTRERAVVTHVRVCGGAAAVGSSLNAVIALAASTGFRPGARLPAGEDQTGWIACLHCKPSVHLGPPGLHGMNGGHCPHEGSSLTWCCIRAHHAKPARLSLLSWQVRFIICPVRESKSGLRERLVGVP